MQCSKKFSREKIHVINALYRILSLYDVLWPFLMVSFHQEWSPSRRKTLETIFLDNIEKHVRTCEEIFEISKCHDCVIF